MGAGCLFWVVSSSEAVAQIEGRDFFPGADFFKLSLQFQVKYVTIFLAQKYVELLANNKVGLG
jgi:hypothetical protein